MYVITSQCNKNIAHKIVTALFFLYGLFILTIDKEPQNDMAIILTKVKLLVRKANYRIYSNCGPGVLLFFYPKTRIKLSK